MPELSRTLTLLTLVPLFVTIAAHAERRGVCKRACVQAIGDCAAARAPMKFKKATRKCTRQVIGACRRTGTAACEIAPAPSTSTTLIPGSSTSTSAPVTTRSTTTTSTSTTLMTSDTLPNFRGEYMFVGSRTASTCGSLPLFPDGAIVVDVTILNGGFGTWLDGIMTGPGATVDAEGERRAPPWWMRSVHDCIAESMLPWGVFEWCADALLTVHGLPPPTQAAPRPPATVVFTVYFYADGSECAITYAGEFQRWVGTAASAARPRTLLAQRESGPHLSITR